jgi:hypothetical protein
MEINEYELIEVRNRLSSLNDKYDNKLFDIKIDVITSSNLYEECVVRFWVRGIIERDLNECKDSVYKIVDIVKNIVQVVIVVQPSF